MKRYHAMVHSPQLGRDVHVWCYGHWGEPLLVFPSAAGMAHEWEAQGMIDALAPWIHAGKLKIYCPESNIAQTWTNRHVHPSEAVKLHNTYERWVIETLVPAIRDDCRSPSMRLATAGCSMGAYFAVNFSLKFPEVFKWTLAMSGRYDVQEFTGGFSNLDIYLNNPLAYLHNAQGEQLERLRRLVHLTLVVGLGPWEEGCIEETIRLADECARLGISHERDIWGLDVEHGWYWWRRQAQVHFGRALPL